MDPEHERRHSGVLSFIAVLVVVVVFWLIFGPQQYKKHRLRADVERTLRDIQPPAGVKVKSLVASTRAAVGSYETDVQFDTVKEHYLAEFARHGFVYTGEEKPANPNGDVIIYFCRSDYRASLVPATFWAPSPIKPQVYTIVVFRQDGSKCESTLGSMTNAAFEVRP